VAKVELTDDAREDLRDLDGSARKDVIKSLVRLRTNPEQRGEPLGNNPRGALVGLRKLVVGNRAIRIVFRVTEANQVAVVVVIGKREDSEVYAMASARLKMAGTPETLELAEVLRGLS